MVRPVDSVEKYLISLHVFTNVHLDMRAEEREEVFEGMKMRYQKVMSGKTEKDKVSEKQKGRREKRGEEKRTARLVVTTVYMEPPSASNSEATLPWAPAAVSVYLPLRSDCT